MYRLHRSMWKSEINAEDSAAPELPPPLLPPEAEDEVELEVVDELGSRSPAELYRFPTEVRVPAAAVNRAGMLLPRLVGLAVNHEYLSTYDAASRSPSRLFMYCSSCATETFEPTHENSVNQIGRVKLLWNRLTQYIVESPLKKLPLQS